MWLILINFPRAIKAEITLKLSPSSTPTATLTAISSMPTSKYTVDFSPKHDLTLLHSFSVKITGDFAHGSVAVVEKKIDETAYMAHVLYNKKEIAKFPVQSRFVHYGISHRFKKDEVVIKFWVAGAMYSFPTHPIEKGPQLVGPSSAGGKETRKPVE